MDRASSIFITGGTSGIGEALVHLYLKKGCSVHTCGREEIPIRLLKEKHAAYSDMLSVTQADISNEAACKAWIEEGIARHRRMDALILNAGAGMRALAEDAKIEVTERIMEINFMANARLTRHALPFLEKTKGCIVGISSMAGFVGLPGRSAYCASKAAFTVWLEALRRELAHKQIHTITIAPGFVESAIRKKALDPDGAPAKEDGKAHKKIMTAETCAQLIAKAIEKKKRLVTMGWEEKAGVFLNRYFPSIADRIIIKRYMRGGKLIQ